MTLHDPGCELALGYPEARCTCQPRDLMSPPPASRADAWARLPYEPCTPLYGSCALLPGHSNGHHGYPEDVLAILAQERSRVAVLIRSETPYCPIHHIPDCSPLLNGCSILSHLHTYLNDLARRAALDDRAGL